MSKKTRRTKLFQNGAFIAIFTVNTISLSWHNQLLPWLYLILLLPYLLLHCRTQKKKIDYSHSLESVFLSKPFSKSWLLHWLGFVFSPFLLALYSFNYKLSFATLLINLLLVAIIYYEQR